MRVVLAALGLALVAAAGAHGEEDPDEGEPELRYTLTLPAKFDPKVAYPAVLALPPGSQDESMVELAHQLYWDYAEARDWIVVSPVAPDGVLFFQGAEERIPGLLDSIARRFRIEGGRFHLAGISNGGISAFRVAGAHPDRFCSLVVFPGLPGTERDFERLEGLTGMPVRMLVGGEDGPWVDRMRLTDERLRTLGGDVSLRVLPGVGHVIGEQFRAVELFDLLDSLRKGRAR